MKLEMTVEQLEEMVLRIVHKQLDEGEAIEYATKVALEFTMSDVGDTDVVDIS